MSVTLTISEEKFGTDELGRNTTLLTQVYHENISYNLAQTIEEIISQADEEDNVEYCNYDSDTFEVYGSLINSIISEVAKITNSNIIIVGGVDEKQLYEVSMSC